MNLHVPQSEEARSEAVLLMRVQDQLISPRFGGPIIGGLRDFITGAYLMTKDDTVLTDQEFANLAMLGGFTGMLPEPANKKDNLYSGKQLFSLFLPTDFNYIWTSKWSKGTGALMHTWEWSDWRNGVVWWLQSVFVEPEFRRRGVFRLLDETLRSQARNDERVVGLRLYVEGDNRGAQATYARLGMSSSGYTVMEELLTEALEEG